MKENDICRYCGGVIKLIPAQAVYGESTRRLDMEGEYVYQCQNCNARVGCHKGTTLERPEGRRLCRIGRCRACGKRLCYGDDLPAQSTPDDLLADIFHRTFQMWRDAPEHLPAGAECFTDLFVSLFHEPDRERVNEWLAHHGTDTGEGT